MAVSVHSEKLRKEQLKRFNGSLLDLASSKPRDSEKSRPKFDRQCVFLTASAAGDLDDVQRLLEEGIDVNTANVDGLTALHQACLNQRLELVKFLVEHSADVNACDNDGWTPLHAACSAESFDVARYLINNGAKLDAVSFDGELPVDVVEDVVVMQLLSEAMTNNGIDSDEARNQEERQMMKDAEYWLNSGNYNSTIVHPKTGASPLHIAAARGYLEVMRVLLQAGANVDAQDKDGWTPVHAAAHWGHKEACLLLVENLCDLHKTDNSGLLAQDVADADLAPMLEELKKKQVKPYTDPSLRRKTLTNRRKSSRSSVSRLSFDQKQQMNQKSRGEERATMEMMFAKRNSRSISNEGSLGVFDVDEEKEEDLEAEEAMTPTAVEDETTMDLSAEAGLQDEDEDGIADLEAKCEVKEEYGGLEKDFAEMSLKTSDADLVEGEPVKESVSEIVKQQNRINESKTADVDRESGRDKRSSSLVPAAIEFVSNARNSAARSSVPATGSLLSSATTEALRALANSHRWSVDDPKRDDEKENARKSRSIQARKEKLEKRRSTQGVTKEDVDRAEASLQAAKSHAAEKRESQVLAAAAQGKDEEATSGDDGQQKNSAIHTEIEESRKTNPTPSSTSKKEDSASPLFRNSSPLDALSQADEDEITKSAALARARRRGRLSARPLRQDNFEEASPDKAEQVKSIPEVQVSKPDVPVSKPVEASQPTTAAAMDRLSVASPTPGSSTVSVRSPHSREDRVRPHSAQDAESAVDYKKLYEKERSVSERLSQQNKRNQQELKDIQLQLDQAKDANRTRVASRTSATDATFSLQEKRALEKKIAELEEQAKQADDLKSDNARLKEENAALIRVISKLSK